MAQQENLSQAMAKLAEDENDKHTPKEYLKAALTHSAYLP